MLTKTILLGARTMVSRRSFGVCVPAAQKVSDPIQQLFLDKIRDYKSKSKLVSGGNKMINWLTNALTPIAFLGTAAWSTLPRKPSAS